MTPPAWLTDALGRILTTAGKVIALLLLIVAALAVRDCRRQKQRAQDLAVQRKAIDLAAAEVEAVKADVVSAQKLAQGLRGRLAIANAKLSKAGARPELHTSADFTLADTAPGTVALTPPGSACPSSWSDAYHRFRVDLPSGLLTRRQMFAVETVVWRGVDGTQRYGKTELHEFDPETKAEIPTTGIGVGLKVQVVDEKAPGPGRWHLYGVAAADQRGAFGGGAQVEPIRHVALTAAGLYSAKDKEGRAILALGWRPGSWTLAIGPYGGYSTKGAWAFGLLGTARVWGVQ